MIKLRIKKILLGILGILFIVFLTIIVKNQQAFDVTLQDGQEMETSPNPRLASMKVPNEKMKRILLYNPTFYLESRNIYNHKFFHTCPVKNCQMVYNKHEANHSDAVIFHLWITRQVPKFKRPRGQVWVMNQHEAPPEYEKLKLPKFKNQFNWTVSYTSKADIILPYGKTRDKPKEDIIQKNYKQIAENKTKDAVWIVSRCQSQSEREKYVSILKRYINVDILGACGKKWECGKRWQHDDCFDILNTTYRYYLAFENALCDDYFTEKFYDNFKYDIIQVVRGGHPKFRTLNISKDAYVSTSDFENAHELGKYLKTLSSNTSKYAAMLEAKDTFQVVPFIDLFDSAVCEICQRLNNKHHYQSVYEDAFKWVMTQQKCYKPQDL